MRNYDNEFPSIVPVVRTRKDYSSKSSESVFYQGKRIGFIDHEKIDTWNKHPYSARVIRDGDNRGEYVNRFYTLFAAKTAVLKAWKERPESTSHRFNPALLPSGDNSEFFPTPSELAGKMLALVDWEKVSSVLEPSAGKGDLIECMNKAAYRKSRYSRSLQDIDCIESDQNLRYILAGKGFRVVHDDFLSFNTHKRYDLILMNPPFSEGDRHLEKALQIQRDGGQVVCLLNAETLRNPYTMRRKFIADRLQELGARVQYIQGAFLRAERKSDVEVAIVSVSIPCKEHTSTIFERMRKAEKENVEADTPKELVGGGRIEQMISTYKVEVNATFEFFREYNGLVPYILAGNAPYNHPLVSLKIGDHSYEKVSNEAANRYMREVRGKYWDMLFRLPELTNKFTSGLMNDYQRRVDKMSDYDFSEFNVRQIMKELNDSLLVGVDRAITEVFEKLTAEHSWYPESKKNVHYYNGWASNKAHKVNKKVIIPVNGAYSDYSWKRDELQEHAIYNVLGDIEKSLDYLDRGVTTDCSMSNILRLANMRGQTKDIEFKYFSATFYKKGTCHLVFHDQRVLDLLNIYAARGRNWLPPNYGKVRYEHMDAEAQAVVDEFQGREDYDRIMKDADYYLVDQNQPLLLAAG